MSKPYQHHDPSACVDRFSFLRGHVATFPDSGKATPHPKRPNPRGRPPVLGKFLCAAPVYKHVQDEFGVTFRKMVLPRIGAGGFVDARKNHYAVAVTGSARRTSGFGHSKADRALRRAERDTKRRALLIRAK